MNGEDIIEMATSILAGEEVEQNFALQIINEEKDVVESIRPWQVLKVLDNSQTVSTANTWNSNPLNVPSNPELVQFLKDGRIPLYNGTEVLIELTQIPFEDLVTNKDIYGHFAVDFAENAIYITGQIQQTCTAFIYYIANFGDIEINTTWLKFPPRFHKYLAFMLAARWRLGVNYDDVAARNADDNYQTAQRILKSMQRWDTMLAKNSVTNLDYGRRGRVGIISGRGTSDPYYRG